MTAAVANDNTDIRNHLWCATRNGDISPDFQLVPFPHVIIAKTFGCLVVQFFKVFGHQKGKAIRVGTCLTASVPASVTTEPRAVRSKLFLEPAFVAPKPISCHGPGVNCCSVGCAELIILVPFRSQTMKPNGPSQNLFDWISFRGDKEAAQILL